MPRPTGSGSSWNKPPVTRVESPPRSRLPLGRRRGSGEGRAEHCAAGYRDNPSADLVGIVAPGKKWRGGRVRTRQGGMGEIDPIAREGVSVRGVGNCGVECCVDDLKSVADVCRAVSQRGGKSTLALNRGAIPGSCSCHLGSRSPPIERQNLQQRRSK